MDLSKIAVGVSIYALPVAFAIILHEVAHGWVAEKFGDPTARRAGRITLNPISHIDMVGTVLLPLIQIAVFGRFFFGWAKPVPVNQMNLRNPRKDMIWVALAGPGTNSPYAVVPVSFDYNDGKGLMVNGATYHYNISNGGILVTAYTYSGTSSGTRSTTLDFSAFSIRWVSGQTVPISVWLESPAGRRSNTLSGGFQTQ